MDVHGTRLVRTRFIRDISEVYGIVDEDLEDFNKRAAWQLVR